MSTESGTEAHYFVDNAPGMGWRHGGGWPIDSTRLRRHANLNLMSRILKAPKGKVESM